MIRDRRSSADRPRSPLVALIANFAYWPKVDAARYLHDEIMPRVQERVPEALLWLVGNDPPCSIRQWASDRVEVTGRVDDVAPYLAAADVVVCPLRIGGGIKVKTIEALRCGKAVVCSSIGAQGLDAEARNAVAIADEPKPFADQVVDLLLDRTRRRQMEQRSARAALRLPSWDAAADALSEVYE